MPERANCNLRQKTACFLFAYKKIKKHVPISLLRNVEVTFVTKNDYEKVCGVEYNVLIETFKFNYVIVLFQPLGAKHFQIKKIKKNDYKGSFALFIKTMISFFNFSLRYAAAIMKKGIANRIKKNKKPEIEHKHIDVSSNSMCENYETTEKKKKKKDIVDLMSEEELSSV